MCATRARQNIPCTARGSGVGSLVCYALKISHVCPLQYDLLFERFLDENRREAPDIDIDFCKDRRGEVIQYVKDKYGEANVAQIGTFGTLAARAAIRDVGRTLGMPIFRVDQIVAMVPDQLGIELEDALEQSDELRKAYDSDGEIRELIDLAMQDRRPRAERRHARGGGGHRREAGRSVRAAAVREGQDGNHHAMGDGRRREGRPAEDGLPRPAQPHDPGQGSRADRSNRAASGSIRTSSRSTTPRRSRCFCRGETKGIFQFESGGIRDLLQRMKPDHFRDIIATNALYRPGPLEGGMVDEYIEVKHGRKPAELSAPGDERSARRNPRRDGVPRAGDADSQPPRRHPAGRRVQLHQGDQQKEAAR